MMGTERRGKGCNCPYNRMGGDWSGLEWNGLDVSGAERSGQDRIGGERKGFYSQSRSETMSTTVAAGQPNRYPVDFDALNKGDVLPVAELEDIFRIKEGHKDFVWKSLNLKQQIERELADRGRPVTVRNDHGALVICTDEDASDYNHRQRKVALRKLGRSHKRSLQVDRSSLSKEQLDKHDRNNGIYGAVLAAALKVRRRLVLKAAGRTTPTLPDK